MKRFLKMAARMTGSLIAVQLLSSLGWGFAGGTLSGTIKDPSGAAIPNAQLTLLNTGVKTQLKTTADAQGFYAFPALAVGRYDLTIEATGFKPQRKTNIGIDADSGVTVDATLQIGEQAETVNVTETEADVQTQVDTVQTHLGEVVGTQQIEALPLNGRSYTDLLAIQPGVTPVTTLTATSVIMAGVTGAINPSGDLNPGDVSIDGQRESANGFMVNGVDVQEHMNGGTSVIPNLDSIQEFRVLTNNFDPEYGNYNGGMVNVVTKSGSDSFHGTVFEFLRNTDLDARNYFDATRGSYQQNQPGGTIGGPIKKGKLYFFVDYQHTSTSQGITSPVSAVMSQQERLGNFSDATSTLTGTVSGTYNANLLTQQLGWPVVQGEPYYTPGCNNPSECVLPNAQIPTTAWSAPATNLLKYIPQPNIGSSFFETSSYPQTVRDEKGGTRLDANTRLGQINGYYFIDNYDLDNPYPGQYGGASVPGFDALSIGQAQEYSIGVTKAIRPTLVNELRIGFLRNVNFIGQPHGGTGVSIASQGFVPGPANGGLVVQAPQYEGVENIVFPSFVMGVPITNVQQWNNTFYVGEAVSKVIGNHSLKFGFQFHNDQVNENPNATFNGTYSFFGTETGNAFADFLLGFPSNFTQTTGQRFYLRNRYYAAFVEDSWRARPNLTVNLGLRWDVIEPWSEKYNNIQTVVPGEQSVLFPDAIPGLVVPGDPGIPNTLSPIQYHNFAPRVGIAYAPKSDSGILKKILGNGGETSIRASFGTFYTAFPGLSAGVMYGVPPFGYNYLSPAPPTFAAPFINAGDGTVNTDPYPFSFPPHGVSAQNPDTTYNWAAVTPDSADPYWYYRNKTPYTENYMFSIQRQIKGKSLLTLSYAGNQGHHLVDTIATNPGNAALCLSLSQPYQVAPGTLTCGPYGEDATYTSAQGVTYLDTRINALGPAGDYGADTAQKTIENSNYNTLEATFRYTPTGNSVILLSYTYSKSIDQGSNIGEQLNPLNESLTRVISSWDMKHNFVASYRYGIPFDRLFAPNRATQGWSISGATRFSTGMPVTLFDNSDNSLLGTLGNGINNYILDTPNVANGPLQINTNPRNGRPEFNVNLFSEENLGQLGSASRRFFYGPGINNFDVQLTKTTKLTETTSIDIRFEAFNIFNHAQFYGPTAVDGTYGTPNFGYVVQAAGPRLMQAAVKFHF